MNNRERTPFEGMKQLSSYLTRHNQMRQNCLNLVASENVLSTHALAALSSDLVGRYSSEFYGGSSVNRKIIAFVETLVKELFDCDFACVAPLSGHLCDLAALNSLTTIDDTIALISSDDGGYPFQIEYFGRKAAYLPFDRSEWSLDYAKLEEFFQSKKPKLTILGASAIAYPISITEVQDHLSDTQFTVFDGSHVLGLIAGSQFQNPLKEGIPVLFGSTHKSFPGPQGGLVVGNDKSIFESVVSQFSIQTSQHPFGEHQGTVLVDNVHSHRIASLGFAILEMLEFGKEYAEQVVRNSIALGQELLNLGYSVIVNSQHGISKSHQILLPMKKQEGLAFKRSLEICDIFVDSFVRIGTSEITRRGYKESEMKEIAEIINFAISGDREPEVIRRYVHDLSDEHKELSFCFDDIPSIINR
ncbi:MAG: hypothetical protein ACFFED_12690 [Candidatus Thorarchaeota archaeon]